MGLNNFWNNFSYGFFNGFFNSNPFMCGFGYTPFSFCCWSNPFMSNIFEYPSSMNYPPMFPTMPVNPFPTLSMPRIDTTSIFPTDIWNTQNNQIKSNNHPWLDSFERTIPVNEEIKKVSSDDNDKPINESVNDDKNKSVIKSVNNDATVNHSSLDKTQTPSKSVSMEYKKMLEFVLKSEGGYLSDDCGEACNMGVRQSTYDTYRKNKGLGKKDVKNLTRDEASDIYHSMYYLPSGANKIKDSRLALQVFDTAVNMGVGAAKKLLSQSGNDADKFEELRLARYESIAQKDPSKRKFLTGWKNRVKNLEDFVDKNSKTLA